ncbi:pilus assembly protein [Xenorhabdus hominickii]|uniref:Fimbrial adhesin, MrxH n=1 Tax=Xenorhabdus hominickii TaxID=351679 RepID=A0A2G0QD68_XENHO|nr:pilus assembly protein [Xenorhabdus hominickii]AOM41262.1 pilus assembly protein [Xenorhabdus hominickii]PHM55484.1 Fimbrial adhesin, MrxH [Xenorhabdus hominickii]PHM57151.1 Fimbrial adhesin, MrxH [Xenorhabdus hominickii]
MCHIKKSLLKLTALLFLLSATHVYGGAYVMPVNTINQSNGNILTTMEIIAWTEEEGIPNDCYGWSKCYVGPDVQYRTGGQPGMYGSCHDAKVCLTDAHKYRTTAEVMRAYKRQFGIPKRVTFSILNVNADCVGLFYADSLFERYGNAQQFRGSVCNKMPPLNQSCELSLPSEIAYGELTAPEVNNATRSINGQFKCAVYSNQIMLQTKSINNEPKVYLDTNKQMYSTLQINGRNAADGVNVTAQGRNVPTNFTLTSMLHTITPPKAGKYEGTAIVYLIYL